MSDSKSVCLIKCQKCHRLFTSPLHFGTPKAFFTCELIGNKAKCKHCGQMVPCNRENMYFNARDGTVYHGSDTIPD